MIYVNQEQLDQVKYLLEQSALGNHILFNEQVIRRLAGSPRPDAERGPRVEKAEQLLEQMILRPTISGKLAFLETLDPVTHEDVARVYFTIVQNKAQETQAFKH